MGIYYNVVFFGLIFVQLQVTLAQTECDNCGCCASGQEIKCSKNSSYCMNGCLHGYWGDTCHEKCGYNCADCHRWSGQCNSCINGYWGVVCNRECGHQCKTCNIWTGCTACDMGYYGTKCENYCGSFCISCNRTSGCTACETGYYGPTCNYQCGATCDHCDNQNGCTSCIPGYYLYNGVCQQCFHENNDCTCTTYNNCTGCIDGYFLNQGVCSHCPFYCKSCISSTNCTSCTDGRFGNVCQYQCTEHCVHGQCNTSTASCQCNGYFIGEMCDQCVAGYFGNDCTQRCSSGCSDTCAQTDGSCTCKFRWTGGKCDTCANKYSGKNCNETCNSNCEECTGKYECQLCLPGRYGYYCQFSCGKGCRNDRCSIKSGYCECKGKYFVASSSSSSGYCHDCVLGRYGQTCEKICPQTCHTCEQELKCSSCHVGYFGLSCDKSCPYGCEENNCKQGDGSCLSCKLGYFGEHCNNTCQESCRSCDKYGLCSECKPTFFPNNTGQCETCNSKCVGNNCDSSSGRCIQGCYDGYWNRTCDTECDATCFSCKQTNGSCSLCKNNTRYGRDCRQECSNTCKSSVCDVNGSCINGCIVNTFGMQCEKRCDENCIQKDNQTICSEKTGMCLYGCRTGYTGKVCPQVERPTTLSAALGGGLGGGILGLLVIAMRRSNTEHYDLLHDVRIEYDTVDTNLYEIELNDLQYKTLQERDDHRMNETTDYSKVSERENGNMTNENVSGGPLS
ncbi:multiple epidermal growth factor-like domains protein 6 isoform X2 [Mya arenaria]|uniref:multiple epidermal growth factor-like domains protein 6 isoform X2 n=1 Tax=Mya arenaria TaxID=6604 RepID=UPI0022E1268B|nr:multiple epidermal growth factor-like domains protein 6 isoform X2 [Mya arenaria]